MPHYTELRWIEGRLEEIKGQLAQLDEQQKAWGIALTEQRQKNGMLKADLAQAENELAYVREELQQEHARQEHEQKAAAGEEADAKSELEKCSREKSQLNQQMEETRRQVAPILSEIASLNSEISQLQHGIEMKRNSLNDSEVLPKELDNLRVRLARAMKMKPGFLQKIRFAEELLAELGEQGNADKARLLEEYRRLAEELEPMEYEL